MKQRLARARAALQKSKLSHLVAAVLAAVLTVGITIVIDQPGPDHHTITVHVGKTGAATPTQVAKAPPAGELQSSPSDVKALRDATPAGVSKSTLNAAKHAEQQIVKTRSVPPATKPIPQAGAQGYSCRYSPQSRGFGAYRSHFTMFDLHYTVSANVPGWSDVYAVKNYLNSIGLSATWIIDFEGHCLQTVRLDRDAYTEGAFNVYGVSAEIIATGKETAAQWEAAPLIKNGILASLVRDTLKSHNLPVRFVDPVGCTPIAGYTDHDHLECGNNHVDVSPYFPWATFNRQVQAAPAPSPAQLLRAKHLRTHQRFVKNHCSRRGPNGRPRRGYCEVLRKRNADVHTQARREHVSLAGTYK